jgi:hypothetical protein
MREEKVRCMIDRCSGAVYNRMSSLKIECKFAVRGRKQPSLDSFGSLVLPARRLAFVGRVRVGRVVRLSPFLFCVVWRWEKDLEVVE